MPTTAGARGLRLAQPAEFLLRPRPLRYLLIGSLIYAALFCLLEFKPGFLLGGSAYWNAPRGLVGGSWADISTALSGYYSFVRDSWDFPIFKTTTLGLPHPVNIICTDSIPILCMLGQLIYDITGASINLFGIWAAFCFMASAVTMTCLVAEMGGSNIASALMATVSGLCMPALLARWGHMSLMAQWEPVFALLIYYRSTRNAWTGPGVALSLLLCAITLWTHAYLFVMVMGVLAAAFLQAMLDGKLNAARATMIATIFAVILGLLVFVSGFFETGGSLAAAGFGFFSMNALSPLLPRESALFPFLNGHYDATGGQYEGFAYLGAGILFLAALALPWLCGAVVKRARQHAVLLLVMTGFVLFAMSDKIYLGSWQILAVPLPSQIASVAGIFRASGRFFWPCLYLLAATLIVGVPARWGKAGGYLLLIAAVLQLVDTGPLRTALTVGTTQPAVTAIAESAWVVPIRAHRFVEVMPSFGCIKNPGGVRQHIALDLQLMASQLGVPTNTVYAARHQVACGSHVVRELRPNELLVLLHPAAHFSLSPGIAKACAVSSSLTVCSRLLDHKELAVLAATGV